MTSMNQTGRQKQSVDSKADAMVEGSSLLQKRYCFMPTHAATSGFELCNNFIANLDETWGREEMKARIPVDHLSGALSY